MLIYPTVLIALSASVVAFVGALHLYYTLATEKFYPRDAELKTRLESVSPVLTRRTTMWKAWIGFEISHALGLLLFAAVYGYLAVFRLAVLIGSPFLLVAGAAFLLTYLILSRVYWFRAPLRAIALALVLYLTGAVTALASR